MGVHNERFLNTEILFFIILFLLLFNGFVNCDCNCACKAEREFEPVESDIVESKIEE